MLKSTFITRLENIKVTGPLTRGVDLGWGVYISNNPMRIDDLLTPFFVEAAGRTEAQYLQRSDAYLYAVRQSTLDIDDHNQVFYEYLGKGQLALTGLWLIKDNSVNLDTGFLVTDGPSPYPRLNTNYWSARFTNSSGGHEATTFSRHDLEEATRLLSKWLSSSGVIGPSQDFDLFRNVARLYRVKFFLQAARAQNRLEVKITHYCTCLETLFSTDDKELSHKVSERVARFLGTSPEERKQIYKQVKGAYDIRSSVVHGDVLPSRFRNNVESYSTVCDQHLRCAIRKILLDSALRDTFSGNKDRLNNFFHDLIFRFDFPMR